MSADPRRAALDARVLDWMREPAWRADPARFDALARDLFGFQFAHCEPYRRYCEGLGRTPEGVEHWSEIPAVPAGAFKEVALRSFPAERETHVFRSSGTSTAKRGTLRLDTLALYEASLLPSFHRGVLPELARAARTRIHVLAPAPDESTDSSLSHMFGCAIDAFGDAASGFHVRGGALDLEGLEGALETAIATQTPVALCGTAFSFVYAIDGLPRDVALPPGSRVMETGGFKGRSRELAPAELYAAIEARFGVPAARIVNQYGMCELGSQFYDSVLVDPAGPRRKLGPPWARVRVVDPETGADATSGGVGMLAIVDLANTGSVIAIQTADLGRAIGDGFEVLGRAPGAEARGCSIAADVMLGG